MVLGRERREKVRSNDDGKTSAFDFPKAAFPKAVKATIMIKVLYLTLPTNSNGTKPSTYYYHHTLKVRYISCFNARLSACHNGEHVALLVTRSPEASLFCAISRQKKPEELVFRGNSQLKKKSCQ